LVDPVPASGTHFSETQGYPLSDSISRGIGLLAAEFGVPVVPIHITGLERSTPVLPIPYRDSVTVRFEQPIIWKPGMSYRDVVAALEAEMRVEAKEAGRATTEIVHPVPSRGVAEGTARISR
jgi:1-acyl-sn-glycerol-3-phosphate acyltransferase